MIDIFICCYLRPQYTERTLSYLFERTKYPFRLFVINNGGNNEVLDKFKDKIFLRVDVTPNSGIHNAWNLALAMAESEYFITSDNDIYVPDLIGATTLINIGGKKDLVYMTGYNNDGSIADTTKLSDQRCWLERLINFMDERPDYGAISLCPQALIGAAGIDPNDPEDVKERNMTGAYMRIMRRDAVWKSGGWEKVIRTGRNHEERTICSRLKDQGYKIGIATRIRAFHPFGENWGYEKSFTPEQQMHNPDLEQYVQNFGRIENYDQNTWFAKK